MKTADDELAMVAPPQVPASEHAMLNRRLVGGMAAITPMPWLVPATNQVANFFALIWLPTIPALAGLSAAHASSDVAVFSVGGPLAGLTLTALVGRLGVVHPTIVFSGACPSWRRSAMSAPVRGADGGDAGARPLLRDR